ncbi:hypothetical protein [Microcystis sp. LE19-195.1E]|uniref:hypothetical protein n=1 Tax=Microcystis sp. LE19-195.1E TaxID=3016440 RepID=UPI0025844DBF|nr:hypothetical protein [Microcystis sp. LE19-195.1E]
MGFWGFSSISPLPPATRTQWSPHLPTPYTPHPTPYTPHPNSYERFPIEPSKSTTTLPQSSQISREKAGL